MIQALTGDCRTILPTLDSQSVQCVVTSPPYYGLRDYGVDGQIGLERTPDEYVAEMVAVFREVRRVLRDDGTVWLNLGDSYNNFRSQMGPGQMLHGRENLNGKPAPETRTRGWNGAKEKDLLMMPARVALALQADGWYLRSEIVWAKPNPMPESVTDRPTSAHEKVFLLTKSHRYFYDAAAVREDRTSDENGRTFRGDCYVGGALDNETLGARKTVGNQRVDQASGRNLRNVWTIATAPFSGAHFATMPPALAERCIKAGSRPGDTILDPFGGAGTTALVADRLQRNAIHIDLSGEYMRLTKERLMAESPLFAEIIE